MPALSSRMLDLPPSLAAMLAELPDDDVVEVFADLSDLPRALAVVDLDRVVADVHAAVVARLHASRLDE